MMYEREISALRKLVSGQTWEYFENNNVVIAGGAITSVFCNREVNDLDVYFKNQQDYINFIRDVFDGSCSLIVTDITRKSVLCQDKETEKAVQLIVFKWFSSVQEIFRTFDFTINMGALEFVPTGTLDGLNRSAHKMVLHEDFLVHNSQRYLKFNENTTFPLNSALRVSKYRDKGYDISKAQMFKILLAVNRKNIDSWKSLGDELGGMYGVDMGEIFPIGQQFTLDLALSSLDNIPEMDTLPVTYHPCVAGEEYVFERTLAAPEGKQTGGRYFKNVRKSVVDGVDRYTSYYDSKFEYKLNEVVNGGHYGIFVSRGVSVLRGGVHSNWSNRAIVEVVPLCPSRQGGDDGVLLGDVKVVGIYSPEEFKKEFMWWEDDETTDK